MLVLSKTQFQAFSAIEIEAYLDRVSVRARVRFKDELSEVSPSEVRRRVQLAFDRFGAAFRRKEFLSRLIVLELLFGPHFERALPSSVVRSCFLAAGEPRAPEAERFWGIYRVVDRLRRPGTKDPPIVRSEES